MLPLTPTARPIESELVHDTRRRGESIAARKVGFGGLNGAVEPNEAMRRAGESELKAYPRFESLAGRAESCSLADGSVDLVVAGQAFHWFQPESSRVEFGRISRPPHRVALSAAQLGVRCCPSEDLWPEDFVLRFGLTADSLGTMRIPNGLTFALSGHNLGPHIDDAPDLTGVAHERPARWQDVAQSPELARRVAEFPCPADAEEFCYGHRPCARNCSPGLAGRNGALLSRGPARPTSVIGCAEQTGQRSIGSTPTAPATR